MYYLQILQSDITLACAHTFHHYWGKTWSNFAARHNKTSLAINVPQVFFWTCCFLTPMCRTFMLSAPIFMPSLHKHTYSEMLLWVYINGRDNYSWNLTCIGRSIYMDRYAQRRLQKAMLLVAKTSASLGPDPTTWETCISHWMKYLDAHRRNSATCWNRTYYVHCTPGNF